MLSLPKNPDNGSACLIGKDLALKNHNRLPITIKPMLKAKIDSDDDENREVEYTAVLPLF